MTAGLVQRERGTTRLGDLHALWEASSTGKMLLAALTALSGMPPFGIFVGELLLVLAGIAAHSWIALGVGLVGISCAFAALSKCAIQIESGRFDPAKNRRLDPADVEIASLAPEKGSILARVAFAATAIALIFALATAIVPWTALGENLRVTASQIGGGQ
jgi:formate hydrogenlyase subunit 3/multisubunit Na+/H+ antiporter MnhD subunit